MGYQYSYSNLAVWEEGLEMREKTDTQDLKVNKFPSKERD